jgi:hypothetical protein
LETELSKANKRADRLEVLGKLDDEDRAAFATLKEADQEAFFESDSEAQAGVLAKTRDAIHKQEEEPVDIPAAIQKRLDEGKQQLESIQKKLDDEVTKRQAAEAVAKAAQDARELSELTKRADTDFGNLPGTAEEKGLILKSLSKLTVEERAAVEKLFQSGNACLASGMKPLGADGVAKGGNDAWAQIEKKAQNLMGEGKVKSIAEGVTKVIAEEPTLYNEYLLQVPSKMAE